MEICTLSNEQLTVAVSDMGAELRSVKDNATGYEYMWQADPAYWGRTAPVLFPVVGSYRDKTSFYDGKKYTLGQHGFARDSEFWLFAHSPTELWFAIKDSPATKEHYPFRFMLAVGYRLEGRKVTVSFHVHNRDTRCIYFSLGAHPAFNCPLSSSRLLFDTQQDLKSGILGAGGTLSSREKLLHLVSEGDCGALPLSPSLFDEDALILEHNQAHRVSLVTEENKKLVDVAFEAPVFGIWSPAGKDAPFVCIEPWYGRCDSEDFSGSLKEREYGQVLEASEGFSVCYEILVG